MEEKPKKEEWIEIKEIKHKREAHHAEKPKEHTVHRQAHVEEKETKKEKHDIIQEIWDEEDKGEKPKKRSVQIQNHHLETIVLILMSTFLIVVIFNQYQIFTIQNELGAKIKEAEVASKPAIVEMTLISDVTCLGCYDISSFAESLRNNPRINVTSSKNLSFDSGEAKALISKYVLGRLPTVIITGDIDKALPSLQALTKMDDALVLKDVPPPFYDPSVSRIKGLVKLTYISDLRCPECTNATGFAAQLREAGLKILNEENLEAASERGAAIIKAYKIDAVPTLILSPDAIFYPIMQQAWPQVGDVASDGSYVLRNIQPPYFNISAGKSVGKVAVTYLSDKGCAECYDVNLHRDILVNGFGMRITNETRVDISDGKGKELVEKYSIRAVPTIILSDEAKYYKNFVAAWSSVGSAEPNGYFVFRNFLAWPGHPYKDLSTGLVQENPLPEQ